MKFDRKDHDRIVRTEASLEALDRLVAEARVSDRRALEIADGASREAILLAREEMAARLDKLNEFRGALADAQATMMPRAEVMLLIEGITRRVEEMGIAQTALLGQVIEMRASGVGRETGQDRSRSFVAGLVGSAVGVVGLLIAAAAFITR